MRRIMIVSLLLTLSLSSMAQVNIKEIKKRAKSGEAQAQYELGVCYMQGSGVKQNTKNAFKWLLAAGEKGHADACYEVGMMISTGNGEGDATDWLNRAAHNGDMQMKMQVADKYISLGNKMSGISLLKQIAEDGDIEKKISIARKMVKLGYFSDAITLLDDFADKMINSGNEADAIMMLDGFGKDGSSQLKVEIGKLYQRLGSKYSEKEIMWIGEASNEGNAEAQFIRGKDLYESYYLSKWKISPHYATAKEEGMAWIRKSADQGYEPAKQLFQAEEEARKKAEEMKKIAEEEKRRAEEEKRRAEEEKRFRIFAHGTRYEGPLVNNIPDGRGTLVIPYKKDEIKFTVDFVQGKPAEKDNYAIIVAFNKTYSISETYYMEDRGHYWHIVNRGYLNKGSINDMIDDILAKAHQLIPLTEAQKVQKEARLKKEMEEWKRTHYHATPREERCPACFGVGYFDIYTNDRPTPKRCLNCYGRGYVLNHYY